MTVMEMCSVCHKALPCHSIYFNSIGEVEIDDEVGDLMCDKCMQMRMREENKKND